MFVVVHVAFATIASVISYARSRTSVAVASALSGGDGRCPTNARKSIGSPNCTAIEPNFLRMTFADLSSAPID